MDQNHRGVYKSIHSVIDLYAISRKGALESSDCVQSEVCFRPRSAKKGILLQFYTQSREPLAIDLAAEYKQVSSRIKLYATPRKSASERWDCVQAAARLRPCSTFYTQFEDSPADNLAFAYNSDPFITPYTQFLWRCTLESQGCVSIHSFWN